MNTNLLQYTLPGGRDVVIRKPKIRDVINAQKISAGSGLTDMVLLANLVVRVDGKATNYEDLGGGGLEEFFSLPEYQCLSSALESMTQPSGKDLAAFKASRKIYTPPDPAPSAGPKVSAQPVLPTTSGAPSRS